MTGRRLEGRTCGPAGTQGGAGGGCRRHRSATSRAEMSKTPRLSCAVLAAARAR